MFILSFLFADILMVVYIFIATGDLIMEGRAGIPLTGLTLPLFFYVNTFRFRIGHPKPQFLIGTPHTGTECITIFFLIISTEKNIAICYCVFSFFLFGPRGWWNG